MVKASGGFVKPWTLEVEVDTNGHPLLRSLWECENGIFNLRSQYGADRNDQSDGSIRLSEIK